MAIRAIPPASSNQVLVMYTLLRVLPSKHLAYTHNHDMHIITSPLGLSVLVIQPSICEPARDFLNSLFLQRLF